MQLLLTLQNVVGFSMKPRMSFDVETLCTDSEGWSGHNTVREVPRHSAS